MGRKGRWSLSLGTVVLAVVTAVTWPAPALAVTDWDGDGATDTDCRPLDPAVHPAAVDHPDLAFEDMNCDGIDGDKDGAYFVQPSGDDDDVGTFNAPFQTIQKAIDVAKASPTKSIYVATGTYNQRLSLPTEADGIRIYGGYEAGLWSRTTSTATVVNGQPETALLDGARDVVFQLVALNGTRGGGQSAYGIRAVNNSEIALIDTTATAGPGATGATGATGSQPAKATAGAAGKQQVVPPAAGGTPCDYGGASSDSSQFGSGTDGGAGGAGGEETNDGENGQSGAEGDGGSPGGDPGPGGTDLVGDADNPAATENGKNGQQGTAGANGGHGSGGGNDLGLAGATWAGRSGTDGTNGGPGYGGGGGGGGAGDGSGLSWSAGAGGGQGGEGGSAGTRGFGGGPGGGSFGLYLRDSQGTVVDGSTLQAGAGGNGGNGGSGGAGGLGGDGGAGATTYDCPGKEGGHGGDGGPGGPGGEGGNGGGGSGGPSFGVARLGTSLATVRGDSSAAGGSPGTGGIGPETATEGASGQSGAIVPAGGPVTDFDDDAVTDTADTCVEIAAPGTANGCPTRPAALPDSDGDGIPNSADSCPATPAGATDANEDGCPDSSDPGTGGGTPGGGVPNPPAGNAPDTTPPVLTASARKQRALRARALIWTASCDEACSYAATAMLGKKRLGKLAKQLAAGARTKLKIRLSRKSQALLRKALKRRKTATVKLKVAAVDAAGNRRTATAKIVVKR